MTVLADFVPIVGDDFVQVNQTAEGAKFPLGNFNTGGALRDQAALFMLSVRFLEGSADIVLNDTKVGVIVRNSSIQWITQHIVVSGSRLAVDGNNEIALRRVTDLLQIKNFVCFFHRES